MWVELSKEHLNNHFLKILVIFIPNKTKKSKNEVLL